jgi:hypothetical protein
MHGVQLQAHDYGTVCGFLLVFTQENALQRARKASQRDQNAINKVAISP